MPKPFSIQTLETAGKTVYLVEAGGCRAESPLLLTFLSQQEAAGLAALLPDVPLRLAVVDEPDWEASFTPWPAPRAFKGGADFGGGADAYLAMLEQKLLPQLEAELAIKPVWRGLMGFSLGGLLAAYAAYRSGVFSRLATVSASLWFDGWPEFAAAHVFHTPPQRAYFSVGDTEKNSRNPRHGGMLAAAGRARKIRAESGRPCERSGPADGSGSGLVGGERGLGIGLLERFGFAETLPCQV